MTEDPGHGDDSREFFERQQRRRRKLQLALTNMAEQRQPSTEEAAPPAGQGADDAPHHPLIPPVLPAKAPPQGIPTPVAAAAARPPPAPVAHRDPDTPVASPADEKPTRSTAATRPKAAVDVPTAAPSPVAATPKAPLDTPNAKSVAGKAPVRRKPAPKGGKSRAAPSVGKAAKAAAPLHPDVPKVLPSAAGRPQARAPRPVKTGGAASPPRPKDIAALTPAPARRVRLTIRSAGRAPEIHELKDGANSLGRDAANDIQLKDVEISRRHAVLTVTPDGVSIADLGSTNGTFVNQARVTAVHPLAPGDVIGLGHVTGVIEELPS